MPRTSLSVGRRVLKGRSGAAESPFDEAYFKRYYGDRRTRVSAPEDYAALARFIAAYGQLLGVAVGSILDVGAGVGSFRQPLRRHYPRASYSGLDISPYTCAVHGWTNGSIADFKLGKFDLVVCHDVLQYLEKSDAASAIENLALLTSTMLYLSVLTREDWVMNCDQSRTDRNVHLRGARWYRRQLASSFRNMGGGLFIKRDAPVITYTLHAGI